jgi:hypothetical protein
LGWSDFLPLIHRRNLEWKAVLVDVFNLLQNQTNRSQKSLEAQYCHDRIEHFKTDRLHNWWHDVKTLCGLSTNNNGCFKIITDNSSILPDAISEFLISATRQVCPVAMLILLVTLDAALLTLLNVLLYLDIQFLKF